MSLSNLLREAIKAHRPHLYVCRECHAEVVGNLYEMPTGWKAAEAQLKRGEIRVANICSPDCECRWLAALNASDS